MRILVVAPGFPTRDGAFTPGVVDTIALIAARHEVEVHTFRGLLEDRGRATYRGIEVFSQGRRSVGIQLASLVATTAARGARRGYDVVWSLWGAHTGLAAAAIARLLRRPLVLSLMGGEVARCDAAAYGSQRSPRARAELRLALAAAARVTTGSERQLERLRALDPAAAARAAVAPLGVPAAAIPARERAPWRPDRKLSLLAVSDTSPVKRLDAAVDAVAALRRAGVAAELDVYGLDPVARWSELAARASASGAGDAVRYRGFAAAPAIYARYAEHDALLHPSLHESQGLALVEAAAAGLPIACLDVGVARELRRLGAAVEIVQEPSAGALARAVEAAARRGAHDPTAVRDAFALERCAARFERLIEEAGAC